MVDPIAKSKDFKHNYTVNIMDGAFFGFAIGFASFSTVIPLFVSTMTTSAVLIGLIPAIHSMGWQLPQLFTANWVARQHRMKPMVIWMTIQERLPFLGLAVVALFLPKINPSFALVITFALLIWQGLGGGFAANPWQNLMIRVIPADIRATFFGTQSAAANLLASAGAVAAGFLLEKFSSPLDFSACFLIAFTLLMISLTFLNRNREPIPDIPPEQIPNLHFLRNIRIVLKSDRPFRWFIVSRLLTAFALMGSAFYIIYPVNYLGMDEAQAGLLTSILFVTQVVANPILGWFADRWSRKNVLLIGAIASILAALLAAVAPSSFWFYPVAVLTGIAFTSFWTIGLALTSEFGSNHQKPTYIGLANTLIAPATILAPVIGGWLADNASYQMTFFATAAAGFLTALVLFFFVSDPKWSAEA